MSALPAVTDRKGKFLLPGLTLTFGRAKRTGTVVTFGHGWARVKEPSGRMATVKPTRAEVQA